jgi:heme A synthase
MGFFLVIAVIALSGWIFTATSRRLQRTRAGRNWWVAFAALTIAGFAVGCWLAFRFEYQVSPRMRVFSFPIPLAFFHLENGHWVDFVTPPYVMYPGVLANVLSIVAMALLPLWLASFSHHTKN